MGFLLLSALPDGLLVLLASILGLTAAFGFVRARTFLGFAGSVVLLLIGGPLLAAVLGTMSSGVQLLVLLGLTIILVRGILSVLLGRGATDRLVAHLAYEVVMLPFRLLGVAIGARRRDRPR